MPANKKPRDQLQDRRPDRIRPVDLVDRPVTVPDAPDSWLDVTKDRWSSYWESDIASAAIDVDRDTVVLRLFTYYDQWERLRKLVDAEPIVDGSMGQPRMHPASDKLDKLEGHISKLEQTVGIGPLARHRLGLTVGQARLTAFQLNQLIVGAQNSES